jgi:hypothetical protein
MPKVLLIGMSSLEIGSLIRKLEECGGLINEESCPVSRYDHFPQLDLRKKLMEETPKKSRPELLRRNNLPLPFKSKGMAAKASRRKNQY